VARKNWEKRGGKKTEKVQTGLNGFTAIWSGDSLSEELERGKKEKGEKLSKIEPSEEKEETQEKGKGKKTQADLLEIELSIIPEEETRQGERILCVSKGGGKKSGMRAGTQP